MSPLERDIETPNAGSGAPVSQGGRNTEAVSSAHELTGPNAGLDAGHCVTCIHWAERNDFIRVWHGPDADVQYRRCAIVPLADSCETPPDPLPLAVAKDGSDYRADLFTLPMFGCVQWEGHVPLHGGQT